MEGGDEPKKKRGRKPKNEIQLVASVPKSVLSEDVDKGAKKTTKRGRKPKFVYSTADVSAVSQNSLSDDENIIVRLNVGDEPCVKEEVKFDDEHPYAYNRDEYFNLSNVSPDHGDKVEIYDKQGDDIVKTELKVVNLLKDFEEKNKVNEWPTNTSICCYWCCHRFDTPPFGIPITYSGDSFDVFGCFCSLECAAAYNFRMQDSIDEMWERYNLINLLFRRLKLGKIAKPAPDRLSLKIFGGYMEIEEFRNFFKSNKIVNINFPPMSSLTQQVEEVNEYEINSEYKYIPLDQDRVEKYKAKIFKRNKPLVNNKNSLETSMNLKYA